MSKIKRITLGVAAGALALGAGLGATSIATAATTPSPSATASPNGTSSADATTPSDRSGKPGGHGRDRGQIAAELATKLGVDEAKVTEALKAFREANKPTTPPAERTDGRNQAGPDGSRTRHWRNRSLKPWASTKPRSPRHWKKSGPRAKQNAPLH